VPRSSTRCAIVAHSKRGQWFVLPDNGVLTLVEDQDGIDAAYDIQNPAWMIGSALGRGEVPTWLPSSTVVVRCVSRPDLPRSL